MQQEQTTERTAQIAVIVPVYNPGQYLSACVDSILAQTYGAYELILVDDGSTDGSGAVCDRYAAQDPRVRVIHKENGGLMSAWMRGVAESTAPYLFFVDSDDWIDQDALERLAGALVWPADETFGQAAQEMLPQGTLPSVEDTAGDSDGTRQSPEDSERDLRQIVCASCRIEREWNHTSSPEGNAAPAGIYEGEMLRTQIKNRLLGNEARQILPSRCMKLIDRRLIEDNLHYCDPSLRMGEDLNITTPAILDADRVVILADAELYHYRYVAASMVHGYDAGLYDNVRRLVQVIRGVLRDKQVPGADEMADREFVYLFLLTLKNEIRRTGVPAREIVRRIRELCRQEHAEELLARIGGKGTLTGGANRLIAFMMDHPSALRIRLVRRIFLVKG